MEINIDLKGEYIESFEKKEPLVLTAYNQNFVTKIIDLFSKEQEKHTGILCYDKTDSELKNEVDNFINGERNVDCLRIQTTDMMQLIFNGIYINGKKIMYMESFSMQQFQTGIIDIDLRKIESYEKLNNLDVELCRDTKSTFALMFDDLNKKTWTNRINPILEQFAKTVPDKKNKNRICIIAENKTNSPKEINLFSNEFENGYEDKVIKVEVPIKDLSSLKTSHIRCFSKQVEQLSGSIKLKETKIEQSVFWTASQFQSIGIDMQLNIDVVFGGDFNITLLPYSKVMYLFYGE